MRGPLWGLAGCRLAQHLPPCLADNVGITSDRITSHKIENEWRCRLLRKQQHQGCESRRRSAAADHKILLKCGVWSNERIRAPGLGRAIIAPPDHHVPFSTDNPMVVLFLYDVGKATASTAAKDKTAVQLKRGGVGPATKMERAPSADSNVVRRARQPSHPFPITSRCKVSFIQPLKHHPWMRVFLIGTGEEGRRYSNHLNGVSDTPDKLD